MIELIIAHSLETIVLILLIAIPAIVNFITWCKGLWAKRQSFKNENINEGRRQAAAEEQEEHRFSSGEIRIEKLETEVGDLKILIQNQQELINLLIQASELDIKAWIKEQHEKWTRLGCIDSQTLELLEQRFAIYTKEGGNSWAKKLMDELRALPTVTVVPVQEITKQ